MPVAGAEDAQGAEAVAPGDFLEVHCTDPLSVIDIPNLIRETGDTVEITERGETRIVFLIEKANRLDRKIQWCAADQARLVDPVDTYLFPIDTGPGFCPN